MLPEPYYERGPVRIYHGDCREIIPTLPKAALVLTDPPYGIDYRPEGGGKVAKRFTNADRVIGDDSPFDPAFLLDAGTEVMLWGGSNFANSLPATRGWLVWDKKCGVNLTNQFSDCEICWTSRDAPIRIFSHRWTGYMKDSEKDDERVHPTQKPIELMKWCIELANDPQDILDAFIGSGTTAVACIRTGRKCIGIEISERYCEIAAKRCDRELDQGRLFAPEPAPAVSQKPLFPDAA